MPFESEEQRRAMYAAAAGKSTIGIPQEVGRKFVAHRDDEVPAVPRDMAEIQSINELDVMKAMRDGILPSPQKFGDLNLFDIRISGTGFAERSTGEIAHRSPQDYLSDEFLERCQGLPVIWEHPEEKLLTTDSFRNQIIGSVALPYVKVDEVWGIARICDAEAAGLMAENQLSTSPAVALGENFFKTGDVLLEGSPHYLDHVAVCRVGVWDKGGAPVGVSSNMVKSDSIEVKMDEENKTPEVSMADILAAISGMNTRMDSINTRLDSIEVKADGAKHDMPHNKIKDDADDCDDMKADEDCDDDDDKKADKLKKVEGIEHCKEDAKDEEDKPPMGARMDSAKIVELERRLKAFEDSSKSISDEDRNAMAVAQSRADSMAMALGDTGGNRYPVNGETPFAFRRRMASHFAKYSNKFKGVSVGNITDEALFTPVEEAIYADAADYAKAPPAMPGMLREVKERVGGREISTFVGDPSAWMDPFANGVRYKGGFRTTQH